MKPFIILLFGAFLFVSCQPPADSDESATEENADENMAQELFERNSQTVLTYLEGWENESIDFATLFSVDYESWSTGFGETDTIRFEDLAEDAQGAFDRFDFELVTDPLNLLPGVDIETKKMNGSVRYYGEWRVTSPASDSTAKKSATLQLYQAFSFDDQGKITLELTYGDFTGLMTYLNSQD